MSIQTFCEAVTRMNSEAGKEHLATRLTSYQRSADALISFAELLAHPNPVVAGNALYVIEAAHMGEAKHLKAAVINTLTRPDAMNLPKGARRFALGIAIDATLSGDKSAQATLLGFVRCSAEQRMDYQFRLAQYVAAERKHKLLREINAIAEGRA